MVVLRRRGAVARTLWPVRWTGLLSGLWFQLWGLAPPGRTVFPLLSQTARQDLVSPQHHWQYPCHPHAVKAQLPFLLPVLPVDGEEPDPFGSLQRGQVIARL